MDVSENMMKLKQNLELPDFVLSLSVLAYLDIKTPKHCHFNTLFHKMIFIKPGWCAWEIISMVLEFE